MTALAYSESQPRADNGEFGEGGGGAHAPATHPKADSGKARQAHFDDAAKRANDVATSGGHLPHVDAFLNKDRHAVSKAERDGTPSATSDATTKFLHDAQAKGADYKGAVYRGTSPAELDQIVAGGNKTTWSVSKDPEGSAHFAKKGGVLLVIPKNSGAIPVDGITGSNTYNEALIPKGSKWKIAGERSSGGVRIVTLEPDSQHHVNSKHEDSSGSTEIDAALADPNPRVPAAGDGGNLDLWGE